RLRSAVARNERRSRGALLERDGLRHDEAVLGDIDRGNALQLGRRRDRCTPSVRVPDTVKRWRGGVWGDAPSIKIDERVDVAEEPAAPIERMVFDATRDDQHLVAVIDRIDSPIRTVDRRSDLGGADQTMAIYGEDRERMVEERSDDERAPRSHE